jgi:hypothetical protein
MKKAIIGFLIIVGKHVFSQELYLDEKDSLAKLISNKYTDPETRQNIYHLAELIYEADKTRDSIYSVRDGLRKPHDSIMKVNYSNWENRKKKRNKYPYDEYPHDHYTDYYEKCFNEENNRYKVAYDVAMSQCLSCDEYVSKTKQNCRLAMIEGNKQEEKLKQERTHPPIKPQQYTFDEYRDNGKKMISGIDIPSSVMITITNDSIWFSRRIIRSTSMLRFKIGHKVEAKDQFGINRTQILISYDEYSVVEVMIRDVVRPTTDINKAMKDLDNNDFIKELSLTYKN